MTVRITDHALLRWLQRCHGIDMDAHRAALAKIAAPYASIQVKHAEVGGLWFVFEGPTLVTVTPDRPDLHSMVNNDRGHRNRTNMAREPLNWKAQARKRNHK